MRTKYLILNSNTIFGATYNKKVAETLASNIDAWVQEIPILEEGDLDV